MGEMQACNFLFICGAVGSGNTLMFDCLTRDPNTYGINEDALGSTLERFLQSEKDFGRCPHAVDTFVQFLHMLRKDRRTLVLKTPSNLRRRHLFRKFLPESWFIIMVREPHAAIVSGLSRHKDATVEHAARTWLHDYQEYAEADDRSMIVTFESLVSKPREVLDRIAEYVMPLSQEVYAYAEAVASPKRAEPGWWQSKVDDATRREVERWVQELELDRHYRELAARSGVPLDSKVLASNKRVTKIGRLWEKLREWSVKAQHKARRHLGKVRVER